MAKRQTTATATATRKTKTTTTRAKASKPRASGAKPTSRKKTLITKPEDLSQEQIAQRAYEIWQRKGRPLGLDEENWLEAVQDLVSTSP